MKKFLTLFVLITFLFINQLNAQEYWYNTKGPGIGTIASVCTDSAGYLYVGTNGGEIRGSSDNGNSWENLNKGLQGTNLMRGLVINTKGKVFAAGTSGVWVLTDRSTGWSKVSQGITDTYIYSLAIDTNDVLYAGTYSKGIFKSANDGQSWELVSGFTSLSSHVQELEFNRKTGDLYAGTYYEGVFRSTDKGLTWTKVNNGITNLFIEAISFDTSGHVFAGTHDGLFRSTDNGVNWKLSGLDSVVILSMTSFKGNIFVGTDRKGIFLSTDSGESFRNTGLQSELIHALTYNHEGVVFAGSNYGYVYRSNQAATDVDKAKTNSPEKYVLEQNFPNPFNPSTNINFHLSQEGFVTLRIYDLLGREVSRLINETLSSGDHTVQFNSENLKSGLYIYRLETNGFSDSKKMMIIK